MRPARTASQAASLDDGEGDEDFWLPEGFVVSVFAVPSDDDDSEDSFFVPLALVALEDERESVE